MNGNIKNILKWTALSVVTLLLIAIITTISLIFGVIYNPQGAFHFAEKYIFPSDLKIKWEQVHFQAVSIKDWDFQVEFDVKALHVTKGTPFLDLPIDHISLRASLFFWDLKAHIQELHIESSSLIQFAPGPEKDGSKEENIFQQAQGYLSMLERLNRRVEIDDLKLETKTIQFLRENTNPIDISLFLVSPFNFRIQARIPEPHLLDMVLEGSFSAEKNSLDANLSVKGKELELNQSMEISFHDEQINLESKGPISYSIKDRRIFIQPQLSLSVNKKNSKLELQLHAKGLPGPVDRIDGAKLVLVTPMEEDVLWSEEASTYSILVPIDLYFIDKKSRTSLEQSCRCRLPKTLNAESSGQLWLATLLGEPTEKRIALEGTYSLESVKNELFDIDIKGTAKIEKKGKEFLYTPEVDGFVHLYSLKRLSPLLDAHKILIPAPLDVLDGNIHFSVKGLVTSKIPAYFSADLVSKTQKVKIQSEAQLQLAKNLKEANVDVLIKIDDLQLDLPPLDPVRGLPRISPDARIQKAPRKANAKQSSFRLNLSFQLETTKPGAVRLLSKYFKPSLPMTLDIKSSNGKNSKGVVKTEPFDIVYLRRTVHVEKLSFNLTQAEEDTIPMEGRFRIQQTAYTIYVDVSGSTKNPDIKMSSEPYLPESEIISVLLYDRTSDQLISADAETAGGVQAAVADRAIGLFGLWAFASTPIKSFSYNPVTKVYSATVAVSDNTTAGIGTNWESAAHLELRRRVSKKWMLTASWTPATQEDPESTKLVLQWESRF